MLVYSIILYLRLNRKPIMNMGNKGLKYQDTQYVILRTCVILTTNQKTSYFDKLESKIWCLQPISKCLIVINNSRTGSQIPVTCCDYFADLCPFCVRFLQWAVYLSCAYQLSCRNILVCALPFHTPHEPSPSVSTWKSVPSYPWIESITAWGTSRLCVAGILSQQNQRESWVPGQVGILVCLKGESSLSKFCFGWWL
jgi:hypothetical protein